MGDYTKKEIEAVNRGFAAIGAVSNLNWSSVPRIRAALRYENRTAGRPLIVAKAILCSAFVQAWDNPNRPMHEIAWYSPGWIDVALIAADLAVNGRNRVSDDDLALIRAAHESMIKGETA